MNTARKTIILLTFVFSVSGTTLAMDVLPPVWRGAPDSTTQEWDFLTDGPLGDYPVPDGVSGINNTPYGDPGLLVTAGSYIPGVGLEPGGAWIGADLNTRILNTGDSDPGTWKDVRVQVTYGTQPGISIPPPIIDIPWPGVAVPNNQQIFPQGIGPTGIDWYVVVEDWTIVPNPPEEVITVTAEFPDTVISEIVVDTIHLPEPATIAILGLGALTLLRKRRAK